MIKKTTYSLITVILLSLIICKLNAQVTVGSDKSAVDGALLQLKQNENIGQNSIKGLGMPRIGLTDLQSLIDIAGNPNPDEHTGLLIYNVNKSLCNLPEPIIPGTYVWEGEYWTALISEDISPAPNVGSVTDQNGNVYPTMHYITKENGITIDAGEWMTENLRATSYDTGISAPPALELLHQFTGDPAAYYFSNSEIDNITGNIAHDRMFFDKHPNFGLMYNWHAATAKKNDVGGANQGQGEPQEQTTVIQGICPNGWHLPSDKEWNLLEKVIAINSDRYSTYPPGSTVWDEAWNTATYFRPTSGNGHGLAMQMPCKLVDSQYNNPNGKSLQPSKGGFSALFVGYINSGDGLIHDYGATGIYWSSSNYNTVNAWFRQIVLNQNGVYRTHIGKDFLGSVRCIKD